MKKIILTIVLTFSIAFNVFSEAIVCGRITNLNDKFLTLTYIGSNLAVHPNYFGPKIQCAILNDKNEFKFSFETAKEYCSYLLSFNNYPLEFQLKDNDSIYIDLDFKNIKNTFLASGKGSGLVNLNFVLADFMPKRRPKITEDLVIKYWENLNEKLVNIIQSFKNGKYIKPDTSITGEQVLNINRLIQHTKLSLEEIELATNRFSNICKYLTATAASFEYQVANIDIFLQLFKNINFSNYPIYDRVIEDVADEYSGLLYLKEYKTTHDSINEEEFYNNCYNNSYTNRKKILKGDFLQKYVTDYLYGLLINGDYKKFEEFYNTDKDLITNQIYLKKINELYNNYKTALNNKEYKLNAPEKVLNDSSTMKLLNSFKGEKVYLIIWKINPGTSLTLTPLWHTTTIMKLQSIHKNIKFIDICLGDSTNKQHWASMIINNQWKGQHYYYASGNRKEFIKFFDTDSDKISENPKQDKKRNEVAQLLNECGILNTTCVGEAYYLIEENGNIISNNPSGKIITAFSL